MSAPRNYFRSKVSGEVYSLPDNLALSAPNGSARVVVIDPEDREQVDGIAKALMKLGRCSKSGLHLCGEPECIGGRLQAALRSLVTDPKPEEPQGLGAVVEDDHRERYVLTGMHEDDSDQTWRCVRTGNDFSWLAFKAVRVLSEGWSA